MSLSELRGAKLNANLCDDDCDAHPRRKDKAMAHYIGFHDRGSRTRHAGPYSPDVAQDRKRLTTICCPTTLQNLGVS